MLLQPLVDTLKLEKIWSVVQVKFRYSEKATKSKINLPLKI